uniref:Uncharacterized protein n=1 Tax=Fagus sylvatica TaxID=28930 RepID=A0A2N9IQ24_FAGSY
MRDEEVREMKRQRVEKPMGDEELREMERRGGEREMKSEETFINMYQALSLQGKRINSLTTEMEQVKLNQKAADKEKGTYIQGQNIQINQGKMPMAEDCHTSAVHNEALVRPTTHNRIPRSRFAQNPNGPQGPYRREPSGPQGPYRRTKWTSQYYSRNYNQQFEDPRSNKTFKPPIAEKGRWVTLGSPNLKPIHQKVYKYGYNPNFNKMTKTQRRRWIRNQAAKQKEMQQGGSSSQAPSEKNTSIASSTQDDMECEETVPIKEDKNIYVGRYIPAQSTEGSYQPRSEIVGPSLRPEYLRNEKKPVEEKEIKKERPYETTRVYIGKKPKRKNQAKLEKLTEEAVTETAKSDLVEAGKIETVDTNVEAEEDLLEDEDDDGEKFALSIGAIRKEEDN